MEQVKNLKHKGIRNVLRKKEKEHWVSKDERRKMDNKRKKKKEELGKT